MGTLTRRPRPSPAMVVALLALFVALGGTSYAALRLPAGSVGTAQLRKNAVTSPKVKPGTLLASDFNRSSLNRLRGPAGPKGDTGDAGARGPTGPTGPAGSALAYARILGTVDAANSKGITAANVTSPTGGVYCFSGLSFTPRNVVVTPLPGYSAQQGTADLGKSYIDCPATTQVTVTWSIGNTLVDAAFFVLIN